MQHIAIYDLDRTLLRKPTFTPFLMFAAIRTAPWRMVLLPIWILAMTGYRLGLYGRKPLKQFGLRLLIGISLPDQKFAPIIAEFAHQRMSRDFGPAAQKSIWENRQSGARIVIATAAPEIYAREIGRQMGIDDVIATQHLRMAGPPRYLARFDGENCYGAEKLRRIELWFKEQKLQRQECIITSYSDHPSDAPMLDWSDQAVLVTRSAKLGQAAHDKGWTVLDFG
jgi:phosphatidylglycerophosphatase C